MSQDSSHESQYEQLAGGTHRVTVRSSTEAAAPNADDHLQRMLGLPSTAIYKQSLREEMYHSASPHQGVLSTARTPFGSVATDLTDDTRITVDGLEMDIRQAVRIGIVQKRPDGTFTDGRTPAGPSRSAADLGLTHEDRSSEDGPTEGDMAFEAENVPMPLDPVSVQALAEVAREVTPMQLNDALSVFTASIARGTQEPDIAEIARRTGLDPEVAERHMKTLAAAYYVQAEDYFESKGVDFKDLAEVMLREDPRALAAAYAQAVRMQNPKAFERLLPRYKAAKGRPADPDVDRVMQLQRDTQQRPAGEYMNPEVTDEAKRRFRGY
jgi:DNA-binding transcriptional ArsR family regulator